MGKGGCKDKTASFDRGDRIDSRILIGIKHPFNTVRERIGIRENPGYVIKEYAGFWEIWDLADGAVQIKIRSVIRSVCRHSRVPILLSVPAAVKNIIPALCAGCVSHSLEI